MLLLLWLGALFSASAQSLHPHAPHTVVVPRASQIVLSRLGIHTHANFLLFDTGSLDTAAMRQDPAHFPRLTLRARCSLPTDRAALPPDLAAFSRPADPPLPNPYGPIDGGNGKPGWNVLPLRQNGKNCVKVLVPSRFADWLAGQPPARRKQYQQPNRYTLVIAWNSPG